MSSNTAVAALKTCEEIDKLESEANPLDFKASEDRVRRLAHLKRQRRVVIDLSKKRTEAESRLKECRELLRNMRLELLKYRTAGMAGASNGLTMVTQQAQAALYQIIREAISAHQGYVFKTIGDAFCAAFPTPTDGLNAALPPALRALAHPLRGRLRRHSIE